MAYQAGNPWLRPKPVRVAAASGRRRLYWAYIQKKKSISRCGRFHTRSHQLCFQWTILQTLHYCSLYILTLFWEEKKTGRGKQNRPIYSRSPVRPSQSTSTGYWQGYAKCLPLALKSKPSGQSFSVATPSSHST